MVGHWSVTAVQVIVATWIPVPAKLVQRPKLDRQEIPHPRGNPEFIWRRGNLIDQSLGHPSVEMKLECRARDSDETVGNLKLQVLEQNKSWRDAPIEGLLLLHQDEEPVEEE